MKVGDKAKLKAIPEENIPEEIGTIIEIRQCDWGKCVVVDIPPEKRLDMFDDGLREMAEDQVEVIKC